MPQDGEIQVGVFHDIDEGLLPFEHGKPVEMGGGEGNLIQIWACHWTIDFIKMGPEADRFVGVALSSNPEHELTPPLNFEVFMEDKALYARQLWSFSHDGIGDSDNGQVTRVIPCYGLIRPRRQIMVAVIINGEAVVNWNLEVYYNAVGAVFTEREEVNRKYGKYRRS